MGPTEIAEALKSEEEYPTFQILNTEEAFKFVVFVVGADAYATEEFARVQMVEVLPNLQVPMVSPEDIVLQKLGWYQVGNKVSDRQWNDLVRVVEIQSGRLDLSYLTGWAEHFGIAELLTSALSEAGQDS